MYNRHDSSSSLTSSSLASTYASHALPSLIDPTEWSRSNYSSSSSNLSQRSNATNGLHSFESDAFNGASGYMFGAIQEPIQYRSVLVPRNNDSMMSDGFNPLAQDHYQARAVDIHQPRGATNTTNWFAADELQSSSMYSGSFAGFGATSKTNYTNEFQSKNEYVSHANLKELSMPRLESLLVSVPASLSLELPRLPLFLEAASFSCPSQVCGAPVCFQKVQDCMKQAGTIVAVQKQYQLTCSATVGVSCSEFNVRCYSGHYRSCNIAAPAAADGTWYTIEFQRRSGCCYGTMQLFKHVVRTLLLALGESGVDCAIAVGGPIDAGGKADQDAGDCTSEPGSPNSDAAAASASEDDMTDISLTGLAMPSMIRTEASMIPATLDFFGSAQQQQPDVSLYDSLLDMLTSTSEQAQVEGLNSLALCLDGSNPRAGELLQEVARKLQGDSQAQCKVKYLAAKLIARASTMPSVAAQVVKHCLPSVLASLMAGTGVGNVPTDQEMEQPLVTAHGLAAQKSLLQSCLSLSSSIPRALTDSEGSTHTLLANSRLKRELLRMTSAEDEDVRSLAVQTIRAIQV